MKKHVLIFSLAVIVISPLGAIPLTALIFQESAKLAEEVAAWSKQCGDKGDDPTCYKRRFELGKFVAMVNEERGFARFGDGADGRGKIMELEIRTALHAIRCLGVPESDSQCSEESAAIERDKAVARKAYVEMREEFDAKNWISVHVPTPPPKTSPSKPAK